MTLAEILRVIRKGKPIEPKARIEDPRPPQSKPSPVAPQHRKK